MTNGTSHNHLYILHLFGRFHDESYLYLPQLLLCGAGPLLPAVRLLPGGHPPGGQAPVRLCQPQPPGPLLPRHFPAGRGGAGGALPALRRHIPPAGAGEAAGPGHLCGAPFLLPGGPPQGGHPALHRHGRGLFGAVRGQVHLPRRGFELLGVGRRPALSKRPDAPAVPAGAGAFAGQGHRRGLCPPGPPPGSRLRPGHEVLLRGRRRPARVPHAHVGGLLRSAPVQVHPHLPGVRQTCHGRLPARPEL